MHAVILPWYTEILKLFMITKGALGPVIVIEILYKFSE